MKPLAQVMYEAAHNQPGHRYVWESEGPEVRSFWGRAAIAATEAICNLHAEIAELAKLNDKEPT